MKYLITAALPYTNNLPHLGNIAGSHLPADIYQKLLKLLGNDVVFIGGTDEHGSPIEIAALKEKVSPKELCDKYYVLHKKIYDWLRIDYDNFGRTSNKINHEMTQYIFKKLYENGYIFESSIILPYCEFDKRFLPDRYVIGTCPYCKYEKARGDQCENCGKLLDPKDLIDPKCAICGNSPTFKESKHLFFDLPKLERKLLKWIQKNKHWKENVKNFALSWLKEGLKARSISRDLTWGIKIPLEGYEDKVFYVWFDAPIGYISSTIEYFEKIGKKDEWKNYWLKNSKARIVHFLGKDNIPFHTIFWPAMLMGTKEFNLPYYVFGLEYLNFEGRKISKSQNWGVFLEIEDEKIKLRILANNQDKKFEVDPDYIRFYLSLILPENKDSSFSVKEFVEKINKELIGNFGNFVYRVLSFVEKYYNLEIPKTKADKDILKVFKDAKKEIKDLVKKFEIKKVLMKVLELSYLSNKYFQENEPWKNQEKRDEVILTSVNLVKDLAILFWPYITNSSEKIFKMINYEFIAKGAIKRIGKIELKDTKINKPEIIFKPLEINI
ncbi:MAG: methionine--tRNA ligase [Candidatus Aenigmatarchaeota archaeon]